MTQHKMLPTLSQFATEVSRLKSNPDQLTLASYGSKESYYLDIPNSSKDMVDNIAGHQEIGSTIGLVHLLQRSAHE